MTSGTTRRKVGGADRLITIGPRRTSDVPARRPPRSEISLAPAAITSSGEVIVGLGYCSMAKNLRELVKVVSATKLRPGQSWFVGVVLDRKRRFDALRKLDDAAAEAAARSGVGDSKRRRGA